MFMERSGSRRSGPGVCWTTCPPDLGFHPMIARRVWPSGSTRLIGELLVKLPELN